MSAKSPRARRSAMCRSVLSYGSAGAAPTTSSPSSSAISSSSAVVTERILPRIVRPFELSNTLLHGKIAAVKAIRIHEDGGPEVLRYEDAPDPEPGADDVLIRMRATSLNHIDLWVRRGLPSAPKPRILGSDGAGIVESGPGFSPGDRVVMNPGIDHGDHVAVYGEHMDGTDAELVAVPRGTVYPIPDRMTFEEAAAFGMTFVTAYRMLVTRAGLQEGETVLIWGIGGGVATAANTIARALGARTIVTSSSPDKLARVEADAKVDHANDDVVQAVK